ncbi:MULTISPECIES: L-glyceraldehyde 3-phosphate reductase [unclassified Streptomyces]|uniref:L-glyceraldehyde 3-phosphate reductase n=1 Tax=Streptomyces TaxID=1883 RepID=UPI0001C1C528|nr:MULTISPECIES: L-glyceraldehyde 3-phosphate reductase [unclassified Streptomyces]MYR68177.1 L-glyceraldehyde 3-phosphate reductase [Streptomyces sp. SID4939]MYR99907.1 L-glyceraldehyde 3-phosphate reductase [Streptomyces sp. SID4940]MYT66845.1 L-glyceraldehyde 3-phosphate reductase [Streptomyces sp. SID8357]MYT88378.1 L-glyceraldehyde 3-phosphate reductase [Streptomyces sp. SID8360]MYU33291.1 L-glyceraldehyde 3-phosphate reductase [Streptomyces sp. SID8358]MYW39569.1 L-glyceraldehyde 3-phos
MTESLRHLADESRYDSMEYRRTGRSGLKLPAVSLGLWHNFGDDRALGSQRAILRRAFDLGVTHFDLANNYGPPPGSAELNFGKIFQQDFAPYRDELIVSTKAGYLMHPGPYGEWGSRKYLLSSLDASLRRMGLDHVDIFYSHRFDPHTPLEETMGALASAVQQGKALYVGVSSYNAEQTSEAARLLKEMGVPALIHQPSYSMVNRWIEADGLLDTLEAAGMGCISFAPLAQGLLTGKYLTGIPEGSRASQGKSLDPGLLSEEMVRRLRGLNDIAAARGQSLAQLALNWVLRDSRMTSALIGASSVKQLEENVSALGAPALSADELKEIDTFAVDTASTNIWANRG